LVALGFAVLVAAVFAQLGIAFTHEPMMGIGLATGPLGVVAGALPLLTALGLHRRSRPLAAMAIPALVIDGSLCAVSLFGTIQAMQSGATFDPLGLVLVAGFAGGALGALLTLVRWRAVLSEGRAAALMDS